MSGRQRTLFQAWGSSVSRSAGAPGRGSSTERPRRPGSAKSPLAAPAEAAETPQEPDDDAFVVAANEAELQLGLEHGGFCQAAGALWIYPNNCPVRDYQLRIARTALFCNTLVCLPTGLGKTFIAAVVMYNFYRWFPSGKVVFMAPTKPLVAQQIEACYRVMGIPQSHMAEMTGTTQVFARKEIWHNRRVLFLTPQVMVNDLSRGVCPAAEIKCLIVDEAHKALGNYAYCQVVRELVKYTKHFRILALSATPGSDVKAVQQVITNLLIGKIELRSEDSPDILPYSHERRVEKLVVPFGEELSAIQNTYIQILETFAGSLIQRNVLMRRNIPNLTKYQLILARDQFRKNPSPDIVGIQQGIIEGEFAICISLYHGYELLQQMGMKSLYLFLCGIMDGTKGMTRAKNQLSRNEDFMKLYHHLESLFAHSSGTSAGSVSAVLEGDKNEKFFYSHPKLKKLEEVVVEHFKSWNAHKTSEKKCDESRVMIFSSFRDSVQEIAEMLFQHQPIIRVMTFVGHSSGKSMKGFTQKEQLEVVKQFRDGGYNTLVSTCVGEEGLDIGEVDLIVCFDAQKSPIRLIQRMGRTGRKRKGRIVVILSEGREEQTYNQSQSNKRSIYRAISGNRQVLHFYQESPRMVPEGVTPELHKMFITHSVCEPEKPFQNMQRMKRSNSKQDWFLSEEEFQLWNRLYRLKDSDEIKAITLPQAYFSSLGNEELSPAQEPAIGIRQLSLSEWRVWQDHPLPTHQVDHSDRCHHFISIMQMIEGMRHEEGECSYELEMKSYLQMEDVSATCSVPRTEYNPFADGTFCKNKKSSKAFVNQGSSSLVTECDEGCAQNSKQPHIKPTKIVSIKNRDFKEMVNDQLKKDHDDFVTTLTTKGNSTAEDTFQVDLPGNKTFPSTDAEVASANAAGDDDVNQAGAFVTECQFANKSRSFTGDFSDSGYNSFSDEKSVLSGLFLPFEEELYLAGADDPFSPCHSLTKEVLFNVEQFLSHSPPPLSGLSNLEHEISRDSLLKNSHFLPSTEHLQNDKSICLMSPSAVNSQWNLELNSLNLPASNVTHLSETSCHHGIGNDKIYNVSNCSDDDSDVHRDVKDENLVPNNHAERNIVPSRNSVKEKNHDNDSSDVPVLSADQNESLLLFDEVNTEFNDTNVSPCHSRYKPVCTTDKTDASETAFISQFLISDELLSDTNSESQDQIVCDNSNWKYHEGVRGIQEAKQKNAESVFDCSMDLFSITFDLGFCSQDSDEIPGHLPDENKNEFLNDRPGRFLGTKEKSDANYVPSQALIPDHTESFRNETTPIPSGGDKQSPKFALFPVAAKSTEFASPGYSQFSLPVGEKSVSTPLPKSHALSSFSKMREEIHKTPNFTKVKAKRQHFKETLNSNFDSRLSPVKGKSRGQISQHPSHHCSVEDEQLLTSNESEDDENFQRKSKKKKRNVLKSPEKNCDADSPLHVTKKRRVPPIRSELSSSDESESSLKLHPHLEDVKGRNRNPKRDVGVQKGHKHFKHVARQFLDDEAELSQEDASCVSSDENDESENGQDASLLHFLNDETQLSQAINDSEMRAFYVKSLHSPVMNNCYKMVHKTHNKINIFSQIPEQDETYMEDSFCVDEEESSKSQSSEEEMCVDFNLITEDCFPSGCKRYKTRQAVMLKQRKIQQNCTRATKKFSRIILPDESSEEENNGNIQSSSNIVVNPSTVNKNEQKDHCLNLVPSASLFQSKVHSNPIDNQSTKQRQQTSLNINSTISKVLDSKLQSVNIIGSSSSSFTTVDSQKGCRNVPVQLKVGSPLEESSTSVACCSSSRPCLAEPHNSFHLPQERKRTHILVDSREITSGSEVISSLRAIHGLEVEVCPLNGCDYIVSNRMVVERRSKSEMLNINKNKFIDQIQHLQSMFERICMIVEKDRAKPGDTSRMFRRTKSYDSLLTALISAGIRILFSSCPEETAELLKELSLLEQRKNVGIQVPTVVNANSHKWDALQFYLSIPNISYITALNMCHQFPSVKKMVNSSPQELSMCAQVTHQKAEEIHSYIHYSFDLQMLPKP
ncbi:Fanconi anemia group M protein [Echinops telfairi]|uniref:Fanconi anemia group M protein n=1 Tax=Echinops telfairi TaxID=9371 RepID=A0AC55CX18_ECHTE|nr:Fanconi anemia group M protein [Echinops telfairi]